MLSHSLLRSHHLKKVNDNPFGPSEKLCTWTSSSVSYFSVPQQSQSLTAVAWRTLLLFEYIRRLFLAYVTEQIQYGSQQETSLRGIYFALGETSAAQLSSE